MKTSEVFRRVRKHLHDGGNMAVHQRYICFALRQLYQNGMIGDVDRTRCRRLIYVHLGNQPSLEAWLYNKHGVTLTRTPSYNKKIMATRKAWLTHLIEHYEAQGD